MQDLISIIMPVKNGEKYLQKTLEGIKHQNMNVEIILVNDGSTDKTQEIAESYGCKIIRKSISEGPVIAKNDALDIAQGEYIMFHDGDDVMNAGALETLYNELENDKSVFAIQAKVQDFISPDMDKAEQERTLLKKEAYYGLFTGAILIRKEAFDIIGKFNETVTAGEIIDWQGKMQKHNLAVKKIDFVSTNRRIHSNNFGKTQQKKEFKDYAALLRERIRSSKSGNDNLSSKIVELFRSTSFYNDRQKISDEEHTSNIQNLLKNLEDDEKSHALNLINKLERTYQKRMISVNEIYTQEELMLLEKVKNFEKEVQKISNGYCLGKYILPIKLFESSVFYYKHGLDFIKDKNYINGKSIIDAGAYIADSALIFRDYFKNSDIHCFEPTKSNYLLALKTVELNNLENVKLINSGLGDEITTLKIKTFDTNLKNIESTICQNGNEEVNITTIDSYVEQNNLTVGLIKTDVEGFEQKLLQGAKQTIITQKPTLLISIYHNYDDFYKIKPLIESWDLGYKFDIFQGVQNSGDITVETMLIAEVKKS